MPDADDTARKVSLWRNAIIDAQRHLISLISRAAEARATTYHFAEGIA